MAGSMLFNGSRSGWSMETTSGFEGQLVKKVACDVINTLDSVVLDVAKFPVGLGNMKEALIQKLNLSSADTVVRIGILGIGGSGKTTLAKAVYNEVYSFFAASAFLFNVRSTSEKVTGLTKLQGMILKDLAEYSGEVRSIDHGKSLMRDRLGRVRALVVLDDMDDCAQLEALVGDWVAPGSRVIITSRDQHILNVGQVSSEFIWEMSGLKEKQALQLFSWHAFQRASPDEGYEDLSKKIVQACHGHPLSLHVIGSFLYDKKNHSNIDCWTETINNIVANEDIFNTLYISYTSLSFEEKEIFLDIACFFKGQNTRYPLVFWRSLYNNVSTAVNNLSMKLLININDKSAFDMHHHFEEMGRNIVGKECALGALNKRTILREAADVNRLFNDISSQHKNVSRLGLLLPHKGGNMQKIKLWRTHNLRYLNLEAIRIEYDIGKLAPNLIWLRLDSCSFANKMNGLDFYKHLWKKRSKFTLVGNNCQLKIMDIRYCIDLENLPDTIDKLSLLQSLDLTSCWGIRRLPSTIGNLSQLQSLNLSNCYSIKRLPNTIGNLSQLQSLNLHRCNNLQNLPLTFGNMSQLRSLDLSWCENIKNLDKAFSNLSQLQSLNVCGCHCSRMLLNTISNLSQLQYLDLSKCKNIEKLPDNFGNLSRLQSLNLSCCNLRNLTNNFGNLSNLQNLDLSWCKNLKNLPDTFGNLSQLESLNLSGFSLHKLADTLGNLSQLQCFELSLCRSLEKLPDTIGNLSQLQSLDLSGCNSLQRLPSTIGNLTGLKSLKLTGCSSLQSFPDSIENLSQLESLDLRRCYGLENLSDTIDKLLQLKSLNCLTSGNTDLIQPSSAGNMSRSSSASNMSQPVSRYLSQPVMSAWTWKDVSAFPQCFFLREPPSFLNPNVKLRQL